MSSRLPRLRGPVVAALCSLLALGCADPDDRPIGPGGGGDDPRVVPDGGTPGNTAHGRLCEVDSFADREPCRPLLNSGLLVSTFSEFNEVNDDGSFEVFFTDLLQGHVTITGVSTNEWFTGAVLADAVPGNDVFNIDIPVMRREIVNAVVTQSGVEHPYGDAVIAVHTVSPSGTPLDGVAFGDIRENSPWYGGPTSYQEGASTTATGLAVYFAVAPGYESLNIEMSDGGVNYMTHGLVGADNFAILPVVITR